MTIANSRSRDTINCPKCGEVIQVAETLRRQLSEEVNAEARKQLASEQQLLTAREKAIGERERELEASEENLEKRVAERLALEKTKVAREALVKARSEISVELADLKSSGAETAKLLERAQATELQLRKQNRELEAEKRRLELEVVRRVDAERQQIRAQALKDADEQHRLKDAEKDAKLSEALRVNDELRRKLEQGSQQTQGEVLEVELERTLRDVCPYDEISEVPKGVRGADVLQKVNNRAGVTCGLVLWEAKNTKNWGEGWIKKLKDDQRACNADVSVLVSDVLPKEVVNFGLKDGVWVTERRFVPPLVMALRETLMEIAQVRRATAGKSEVIEALFRYATGPEFRNRVESIARNFIEMKEDLDQERRLTTRRWAKRSKQLDLIIVNTSAMYGELQGLIGNEMKPIPALEESELEQGKDGERQVSQIAASAEED